MKKIEPINIMNKFSLFNEEWTPKIIGELNGQHVKVCKLKGDFVWHSHENEDELFMVFKGKLLIDFRDGRTVEVKEGINPRRALYLITVDKRRIPLTGIGDPMPLFLLEEKATTLAKFLNIPYNYA